MEVLKITVEQGQKPRLCVVFSYSFEQPILLITRTVMRKHAR